MAIPETIKKLANDVRTKVYGREVREALASGIEAAGSIANDADVRSQETETKQTSLEKKYDEQIANMSLENPNVAEVVDARVSGYDGQSYTTIGKRFDSVDAQLADISTNIESFPIQIPEVDDTLRIQRAIDSLPQSNPDGTGVGGFVYGNKVYIISKPLIIQNGNVTFGGNNKGGFTIKASESFVGDCLLHWNTGGKWNYITNCSLKDVTFDCNNMAISGPILESWYDNCNIDNVNVKNFKDVLGFIVRPGSYANDVSILQGITLKGVEVNPWNVSTAGTALFEGLFESSLINCKFWSVTNVPNTRNSVDVVTFKRCRGLNIFGGASAAGNNLYVVDSDDLGESRNVNFYGVTVEAFDNAGIYFKGTADKKIYYPTVSGLRSVTPRNKDILFDYCVGGRVDIQTDFNAIELTANADRCMLVGFLSGGTITDNGQNTMQFMYDTNTLQINKQLKLKNGTKLYDDGTRTLFMVDGDKLQILNEAGTTVIAEISINQALFNTYFRVANQNYTTVAPAAGTAGALPSQPAGYWAVTINGTPRQIPYY